MNQRLRDARHEAGKSQIEMALEADISARHYRHIEYGGSQPSVVTAIRIAKALGKRVEDVFVSIPSQSPKGGKKSKTA